MAEASARAVATPSRRDEPSLEALAARAVGDRAAFAALHDRVASDVFAFVAHVVRDRALAEDLLQEVFLRVHGALGRWDRARPFRPWLHAIVRNVVTDALRARRKDARALEGSLGGERRSEAAIPLEAARREATGEAAAAFAELDDETRLLLTQRHGLGLSLDEIATVWDCTERTVRNRLEAAALALARRIVARRAGRRPS